LEPIGFGGIQDLINDLIFDPWDFSKADRLQLVLAEIEPRNTTGLDSLASHVMERVERLAKVRIFAESGKGDTDGLYQMLESGYQRLLDLIKRGCGF